MFEEPRKGFLSFWAETVRLNAGEADASIATKAVRVGNRAVPNRIRVHFPGANDGQPSLSLELEVIDGIPQCRSVQVDSVKGGREVRRLDLDAIKLDQWVADMFALFAFEKRGSVFERVNGGRAGSDQERTAANDFQRARRGKGARIVNKQVITEAVKIYKANYSERPIKAIAMAFDISERTASNWITRARSNEFKLLPPTKPGQKKM